MESENPRYLKIIKHYIECSDEILKNVPKKSGAAIVLVSILWNIWKIRNRNQTKKSFPEKLG